MINVIKIIPTGLTSLIENQWPSLFDFIIGLVMYSTEVWVQSTQPVFIIIDDLSGFGTPV